MKTEKHKINNYRTRKLGRNNLVTADDGSWIFLNDVELIKLKNESLDSNLAAKLKKSGIMSVKNNEKAIEKTRRRFHYLFRGTSLHIIVPTLRCNYKCVYCHASSKYCGSKKYDMDKATAKKAVDFIFQSPAKSITMEFQGGEPMMNFEIVKYITEYAKKKNAAEKKDVKILIVSNLSLIEDDKLDYILRQGIGICTSLDGPKKVHDSNRQFLSGVGSYEETVKKMEMMRKKGVDINALTTITKNSLKYGKEIVDEYVKQKIKVIHIRFLNNLGYAKESWKKISYEPEEFVRFWKECLDYIVLLNKKGIKIKERSALIILQKIFSEDPDYLDMRNPCGAVIGQLLYNYDGRIYTCDEGRMTGSRMFCIGNVRQKFADVVTCEESCAIIASSVNETSYCDCCAYRPFCGLCPVCNYAEHGNILAQIPATRRCKIFKAQFDYIFRIIQNPNNMKIFRKWLEEQE